MKYFLLFFILLSSISNASEIKGTVTDGTNPVSFARVMVKGTTEFVFSINGNFVLENIDTEDTLIIAAWAEGFYNSEVHAVKGDSNVVIELHHLPEGDNENYQWLLPYPDETSANNCGNCHSAVILDQWQNNAHGNSAKNKFFYSMYNGTDLEGNSAGVGFKFDFPESDGNCTLCHIPSASLETMQGVNPNNISAVDSNGVFCDFCHKIESTSGFASKEQITKNYGVLSINLNRPPENEQIFFGPYIDVHNPDAFNPNIKKSDYCAPCHSGYFWNDFTYGSFVEWQESDYPANDIHCQTCHMAPDGVTTNFAPGKGGIEREARTIPSHLQPGSRDTTILQNSVSLKIETEQKNDSLIVKVLITNDQTGHHVPTDRPSRNLILLVDAENNSENSLEFIKGETVPFWGGEGNPGNGNYAGLPGKGFAKVLKENKFFNPRMPVPAWVEHYIYSDNRIAAMQTDTSIYYFKLDESADNVNINARLLYRRFYKEWIDEKSFDLQDIEMENETIQFIPKVVGIDNEIELKKDFYLSQNYPNPFNPTTKISFTIPAPSILPPLTKGRAGVGSVNLVIFDALGNQVKILINNKNLTGYHEVQFDASNLPTGVYYYRLQAGDFSQTKKMLLIK